MTDLIKARTSILENACSDLSAMKGVSGLFLGGSLADDSADCYSDIDLRVVVEDQHFLDVVGGRENAPVHWGDFLFHETIGPNLTVSYYRPFNKIDLFYYKVSELSASPWYSLPTKILLDNKNIIANILNKSKDLKFEVSNIEILNLNRKAVAIITEVVKRIARGEYLYAHRMTTNLVEVVLGINDCLDGVPPLGSSKFIGREETAVKTKLATLSFARENQISDLKTLIDIVSKNVELVGVEQLPCALQIASDELDKLSGSKNSKI